MGRSSSPLFATHMILVLGSAMHRGFALQRAATTASSAHQRWYSRSSVVLRARRKRGGPTKISTTKIVSSGPEHENGDSWAKWEFGDEAFIDRAIQEHELDLASAAGPAQARSEASASEAGGLVEAGLGASETAVVSGTRRVVGHRTADHRVANRAPSYEGGGGRKHSTRLAAEGGSDGGDAWRAAAMQTTGLPPPEVELGNTPLREGQPAFEEAAEVLKPFTSEERVATFEKVLSQRTASARFVIEDPINPSNAWACLRSLDSFGVQYVDVITNPENYIGADADGKYKRMNVAMGTQKWLEMAAHTSSTECITGLKDQGYTILATDLSPGAVPIHEVDWANIGPFAIVLGNEEQGISQEMRELADTKFYVPMKGFAQSFSLSVGCAVIASHLSSQGALGEGSLSKETKDRLLFKWLLDTIKGGRAILRREGFDIPLYAPKRTSFLNFSQK